MDALNDPDRRIAVTAAGMLLDRGWGKPAQAVIAPDNTQTLQFQHLVAARAFSEQLIRERAANGWAVDEYAPDVRGPPLIDLLQPALE